MISLVPFAAGEEAELATWVSAYFAEDGLEFSSRVASSCGLLLSHPEWGSAFRVVREEATLGYIVLTYGFDHEVGGRVGMVTDFYLEPSARGQGIGHSVLALLQSFAQEMGLAELELFVLKHNLGARRLYASLGFQPADDREYLTLRL